MMVIKCVNQYLDELSQLTEHCIKYNYIEDTKNSKPAIEENNYNSDKKIKEFLKNKIIKSKNQDLYTKIINDNNELAIITIQKKNLLAQQESSNDIFINILNKRINKINNSINESINKEIFSEYEMKFITEDYKIINYQEYTSMKEKLKWIKSTNIYSCRDYEASLEEYHLIKENDTKEIFILYREDFYK